jgi:molybdopterin biosynthesis enzyme
MGRREVFRAPRTGQCATKLKKPHDLIEFVRALAYESDGQWRVAKVGPDGSSNLRSMVNANAFIILPEQTRSVAPGNPVAFELFSDPPTRASV